ncbi:MAG TPA: hypothetical protein VFU78_21960 [Thermomicrobiales bacterium]|nr:hypothetical protein [Thermomicrobiales bacterium]
MPSLLEALEAREVEVRGRLEELAGQVAVAQTELDRLVITRETVQALLGPGSAGSRPGGDDRSARMSVRRLSPGPGPGPGPGPVLPEAVAAALGVIEGSDVPLRAREVCEVLGERDAAVQAMRNRLGRLAKSGLVVALEPGLYVAPGRAR